ncbi:hypothetical protein FACS1894181_03790 [Bacteroidia bacterium]|nr:hypothetical protein FACS1894181_03790 [Bacteroidia bacterium]
MKKIIIFGRGKSSQGTPADKTAPAVKPKTAYTDKFLKRRELKTRQCVYISHDVHGIVARLVRSFTDQGRDITVGGYIDTVLTEHFKEHRQEINELYRQRNGDLF